MIKKKKKDIQNVFWGDSQNDKKDKNMYSEDEEINEETPKEYSETSTFKNNTNGSSSTQLNYTQEESSTFNLMKYNLGEFAILNKNQNKQNSDLSKYTPKQLKILENEYNKNFNYKLYIEDKISETSIL